MDDKEIPRRAAWRTLIASVKYIFKESIRANSYFFLAKKSRMLNVRVRNYGRAKLFNYMLIGNEIAERLVNRRDTREDGSAHLGRNSVNDRGMKT